MKLSEAIRKGSKGTAQTKRVYIDSEGATCAMGAALKAAGCDPRGGVPMRGKGAWMREVLMNTKKVNPATRKNFSTKFQENVFDIVVNLNDDQGWTREAIAEWLEGEGL